MESVVVPVVKPVGVTPLETIQRFKKLNPQFSQEKISYAGRLDPMAEGLLLLLIGEENKKRKNYESLKKTYETDIILGIETDSFDALGMVLKVAEDRHEEKEEILSCLKTFVGRTMQKYPPYSSKPVGGKPLFWWARSGRLSELEIPRKEIEISECTFLKKTHMSGSVLFADVMERIEKITGDFRQKEIKDCWKEFEKGYKNEGFTQITLRVSCSSGTYIRRLADDIGKKLGCGAFALTINRTSVGKYSLNDCLEL